MATAWAISGLAASTAFWMLAGDMFLPAAVPATVTLVTPSPASCSTCWGRWDSPLLWSSTTAIVATSLFARRRRSVGDATGAAGPGSSVRSLTFELRHACRELGPVANAGLAEHVRDAPLHGLPRQRQPRGDPAV